MKKFSIVKVSTMFSTTDLIRKVEQKLSQINQKGFDIVSVAFGVNMRMIPTCYITIYRTETEK